MLVHLFGFKIKTPALESVVAQYVSAVTICRVVLNLGIVASGLVQEDFELPSPKRSSIMLVNVNAHHINTRLYFRISIIICILTYPLISSPDEYPPAVMTEYSRLWVQTILRAIP
jgi:hypothetical protein